MSKQKTKAAPAAGPVNHPGPKEDSVVLQPEPAEAETEASEQPEPKQPAGETPQVEPEQPASEQPAAGPVMVRYQVAGSITNVAHGDAVYPVKNGLVDLPAGETWYQHLIASRRLVQQ